MRFKNKSDALNYMTKLKDDVIEQYTYDYKSIISLCSDMYNKSSVKKLVSDAVSVLKQDKYKYIFIRSKWIVCSNSNIGDSTDWHEKIFPYSNYGLDDIKEQRICLALMHILCTELEKTNIVYHVEDKISLCGCGDREYWKGKGFRSDCELGDKIRECFRKGISNSIKGSGFLAERLKIQKHYCTITESQRIYGNSTSHDYYKDYKLAAAFKAGWFQNGGSYVLNDCALLYKDWSVFNEIILVRKDMIEKTQNWI